jgi:O-antigen ligase/polysaccharide polymerase Wzy-like membrane protein
VYLRGVLRRRLARLSWEAAASRLIAILPGLATAIVVAVVGVASGGYFPRTWRLSAIAFAALAGAALLARRRIVLARRDWAFLALLAAVTVWTGLSARWSDQSETSLLEAERTSLYLLAVLAILVAVERRSIGQLLGGVVVGATAVSAYGLGKFVIGGHPLNPIQGNLLFEPIGYANGLGIYAAVAIVVSVGLALAAPRRRVAAVALVPLAVLAPTLYLTSSRGADMAVAAGLVTIAAMSRRISRAAKAVLGAAALAAIVAVVAVSSSEHGLAAQLAGANRPHYWGVAWKEYTLHPITGSGAGTFDSFWLHYRPVSSFARDAHSLYVETLAELGPVGLALVVLALGVPLLALRRRGDPLLAAAAAGYVAFVLHAGVDWDWELPSVTLTGLACGAALLAGARPARAREARFPTRVALIAVAVALAVVAIIRLRSGPTLPFAS